MVSIPFCFLGDPSPSLGGRMNIELPIPYATHGAGILTYKTGWFLGQMLVNIPYNFVFGQMLVNIPYNFVFVQMLVNIPYNFVFVQMLVNIQKYMGCIWVFMCKMFFFYPAKKNLRFF